MPFATIHLGPSMITKGVSNFVVTVLHAVYNTSQWRRKTYLIRKKNSEDRRPKNIKKYRMIISEFEDNQCQWKKYIWRPRFHKMMNIQKPFGNNHKYLSLDHDPLSREIGELNAHGPMLIKINYWNTSQV